MSQDGIGEATLQRGTIPKNVRTLRVKMVLLGTSGVGKTSLATRFVKGEFKDSQPTVGCAYQTHVVNVKDASLRFEIWDTAGQEKYLSVTPLYYRGAHAALVLYDISKRDTFMRAQMWLKELEKQYIPGSTVVWLVGNKGDLAVNRQVSIQEGQCLAEDRGLEFIETSALSGHQVNNLLQAIAHKVYELTGGPPESLSEWQEFPSVDINNRGFLRSVPVPSCCS